MDLYQIKKKHGVLSRVFSVQKFETVRILCYNEFTLKTRKENRQMKLNKVTAFFATVLLMTAFTEVKSTAAEDIIYGEMKDGFFIRTYYEECLTIPYEWGTPEYEAELKKLQEARWLDELTPQMQEAGWVLVNGAAYPPEEMMGEAGEGAVTETEVTESNVGYLTISVQTDGDITGNCYVEVAKTDDGYKLYSFMLYQVNGYSTSAQELPVGHYEVAGGGLEGDVTSMYKVSGGEFDISTGSTTILPLTISTGGTKEEAEILVTQQKEDENRRQELEEKEEKQEKNKTNLKATVISLIITAVILAGGFILWKRKR